MTKEDVGRYEAGTSPFRPQQRPTLSTAQAVEQRVEGLGRDGIDFVVARLKSQVRHQFDDNRLTDRLGEDRFFPTVSRAVEWCSTPSPED